MSSSKTRKLRVGFSTFLLLFVAVSCTLPNSLKQKAETGYIQPSLSSLEAKKIRERAPPGEYSLSSALHKTVFPGGLTLITQRRAGTRTVAIQVWVRVGSRYETQELNGISHFMEHMLFKGSSKYTGEEIRRKIRSVGGYLNGETFWEYTKYYTVVPADHAEIAIDVLGEMVMNALIRPEDVDTERKVVLEEINRFHDDPRLFALNVVTQTLFPNHPLGRPVVGTEKTIKNITQMQLVDFYQSYYTADNLVLVVVGDIDSEEVKQWIDEKFSIFSRRSKPSTGSDIKNGSIKSYALIPPSPQQTFRKVFIERLLFQVYVALGIPTMGVQDKDRYVMDLINVILGSGKNSRIYQRIKEQEGLSDEIGSVYLPLSDIGAWGIYVGTSSRHIERVQALIFQEVDALKNKPLSDTELALAKQTLEGNFLIERDDNNSQADFYGWFETIHKVESVEDYLDKIRQISPQDVQRVANQYFRQDAYNLFVVKPVGGIKKVLSAMGYLF
jgi:predicted Zn-dependent peptidase